MCDIAIEDVGGEICEPVAGFTTEFKYAAHKDFTTIVDPPAALTGDFETLASITGPHVAATGKGFATIEGVDATGTITSTMIGEPDRHLFENVGTIVVAGSSAKILGFCRAMKNFKGIFLFEEAGSGNLRQLGSKRTPARFTGIVAAIEAAKEGANTVTLTVSDKQLWPAPIYTGDVPMLPAP